MKNKVVTTLYDLVEFLLIVEAKESAKNSKTPRKLSKAEVAREKELEYLRKSQLLGSRRKMSGIVKNKTVSGS